MQNRKWQVLIVEDEYRIGMLIKHLIDWDEYNMECVDVVDNGESALRIIENSSLDIVITDIRMKNCWKIRMWMRYIFPFPIPCTASG